MTFLSFVPQSHFSYKLCGCHCGVLQGTVMFENTASRDSRSECMVFKTVTLVEITE